MKNVLVVPWIGVLTDFHYKNVSHSGRSSEKAVLGIATCIVVYIYIYIWREK